MRLSILLIVACLALAVQGKHTREKAQSGKGLAAVHASDKAKSLLDSMLEIKAEGDADGLNSIITLVKDTLIPGLKRDVATRQTELDTLHGNIGNCGTSMSTCLSSGTALTTSAGEAETAYNTATAAKNTAATVEVCETGTFEGADGADEVAAKLAAATTKFNTAVTAYNTAAAAEKTAAEAFWAAKDKESAHVGECHGVCNGCVTASNTAYDEAVEGAKKILPSQQDDLRTYTLIICVATESANTNNAESLKACREAETDVSSITYVYREKTVVDCGSGGVCASPEAQVKCDSAEGKNFLEGCAKTFCEVKRDQCVVANTATFTKCMTCMDEWCATWPSSAWCPTHEGRARDRCKDHSTHTGSTVPALLESEIDTKTGENVEVSPEVPPEEAV